MMEGILSTFMEIKGIYCNSGTDRAKGLEEYEEG
jgi:hypothetical protein